MKTTLLKYTYQNDSLDQKGFKLNKVYRVQKHAKTFYVKDQGIAVLKSYKGLTKELKSFEVESELPIGNQTLLGGLK